MFDDPINAMGYADFDLIMPSLLQMGDRMSSAFSIENRCPFLDLLLYINHLLKTVIIISFMRSLLFIGLHIFLYFSLILMSISIC